MRFTTTAWGLTLGCVGVASFAVGWATAPKDGSQPAHHRDEGMAETSTSEGSLPRNSGPFPPTARRETRRLAQDARHMQAPEVRSARQAADEDHIAAALGGPMAWDSEATQRRNLETVTKFARVAATATGVPLSSVNCDAYPCVALFSGQFSAADLPENFWIHGHRYLVVSGNQTAIIDLPADVHPTDEATIARALDLIQ